MHRTIHNFDLLFVRLHLHSKRSHIRIVKIQRFVAAALSIIAQAPRPDTAETALKNSTIPHRFVKTYVEPTPPHSKIARY